MWVAKLAIALAMELYGGQNNYRSVELNINYQLTFNLLRQKRKAAILASTVAKGFSDRIVHTIELLSLIRLRLPSAPI